MIERSSENSPPLHETFADPRGLADSLPVGIIVADQTGRVIDTNARALEILGVGAAQYDESGLRGAMWDVVRPDGTPLGPGELPIDTTLRTGRELRGVLIGTSNRERARRWLLVDTDFVELTGARRGVVVTFTDASHGFREHLALTLSTAIGQAMISARNDRECLRAVCEAIIDPGLYALAWVGAAASDGEGIDIVAAAGATDYLEDGMITWWGNKDSGMGPTGTALRTGQARVGLNLPVNAYTELWRQRAATFGLGSSIALPFTFNGQRMCLTIYDADRYWFDDEVVAAMEAVTRQIAFGLEHVHSIQQLSSAFNGTLAALSQLTERRDPHTAGHQARLARLSDAIATRLGLDSNTIELVRQSAEVCDVGKVVIPADILTRPGPISDVEFDLVKTHCAAGHEILSQAQLPWPIAEVALQHHERLDGSGYPHGLRDKEISLPARIVAVSDVVEAMASDRPYRRSLGVEAALDEISRGAGTLYDADVVTACRELFTGGFDLRAHAEVTAESLAAID